MVCTEYRRLYRRRVFDPFSLGNQWRTEMDAGCRGGRIDSGSDRRHCDWRLAMGRSQDRRISFRGKMDARSRNRLCTHAFGRRRETRIRSFLRFGFVLRHFNRSFFLAGTTKRGQRIILGYSGDGHYMRRLLDRPVCGGRRLAARLDAGDRAKAAYDIRGHDRIGSIFDDALSAEASWRGSGENHFTNITIKD